MKRFAASALLVFMATGGCSAGSNDPGLNAPGGSEDGGSGASTSPSSGGSGSAGGGTSAGDAGVATPASEAGASLDGAPPPNGTGGGGTIVVPPPGWTLLWSDEFDGPDGSDVDPTKWIHDVGEGSTTTEGAWSPGYGWGNDELEYYTAGSANTQQQGGNLVISATKNADPSLVCYFADDPSSASTTYHAGTCEYASGRIKTVLGPKAGATGAAQENLFSHLYGRFEMRAQIPPGVGLWPAFWMMGTNIFSQSWPACGELDIMEEVGDQPGTVHGTSHSTASGDDGVTFTSTLPHGANLSDAFHVYAIEWTPTKLTWLLDDAVYGTQTAPSGATASNWPFTDPKNPFFLILNLAISSGDANSWGAAPTSATPFPAQMKVDYVRVFEPANGDD